MSLQSRTIKGEGSMRRAGLLAALTLALLIPVAAQAAEPPAVEPAPPSRPGMAPVKPAPTFTCVPVRGNPELERAQSETPPPTGPEGQPTPPRSGNSGACPPGSVGVSKPSPGIKHRPSSAAAPNTALAASEGYFYVGDIWESAKPLWVGAVSGMEFSAPNIPEGAASGAHSVVQETISSAAACNGGMTPVYTIEIGWIMERTDIVEGWVGPRLFEFVNPDCYGPKSCYNCDLVLANGESSNPFNEHYYPTDGTPNSRSDTGVSPYRGFGTLGARQYKGKWWLWVGDRWVGTIADNVWATPTHPSGAFKVSNEVQTYGEVYDRNPPLSQMGNGNKGGCLCATAIRTPQLAKKPLRATEEPAWSAPVLLHSPLANVSPGRYTWGNVGDGGTTVHLGG